MPSAPNPKFDKAVADFTNILIDNELIVEDFLFKEKKCKCIRVYYKRKIFYIIKTCDFTTADVLEDHQNWLDYLECIKKEMCCYIREKTECVPICIKQTLLKSFQSMDGEVTYIMRVDVKNESDKKIKNLVVRDLLLKRDMCVGLLEVLIDYGCSVKPVDQDTPEQYVGNGYLLDPRKSCLDPHAEVSIVYTVQLIDQTTTIHNMVSRVEVYGRLVHRVGSEMILDPISRAGDIIPANAYANESRDLNSRDLINYFIPSNCIALKPEKFGVNNATISRVINGVNYTVKLTSWVKKSGTSNQYIKVNYELIPSDKGVVNKIIAVALNSVYTVTPNNTSGTFSVPLNTVIAKSLTRQTTFLLVLFCITTCIPPTITLSSSPTSGMVINPGTPVTITTTVTGTPTPTVTYALNDLLYTLSNNTIDTTNFDSGSYTLVATATNTCGSATSNSISFSICAPPTITLISVTPTFFIKNVSPYPNLTINYTQVGATSVTYQICDTSLTLCQSGSLTISEVDISGLAENATYNVTLTATNGCGTTTSNALQFNTPDTIAPNTPIVSSIVDSSNISISNGSSICQPNPPVTYNITVNNAEVGSTVQLYDNNTPIGSPITADLISVATFSGLSINAVGSHAITATATDASGNISSASSPFTFTIVAPPTPGSVALNVSTSNVTTNSFDYAITVLPSSYTLTYNLILGSNTLQSNQPFNGNLATGSVSNASFDPYFVEIIGSNGVCAPVLVGGISFSVCLLPIVSVTPLSQTVTEGDSVIFSTIISNITVGDVPTYQWYKNNAPIPNETLSSLTLSNVSFGDKGSTYYVVATNGCGASSTPSNVVALNVNALPLILSVLDSQNNTVINGSPVCSSPSYTINVTQVVPGLTVKLFDNDVEIGSTSADQSRNVSFNNVNLSSDEIHLLEVTVADINSNIIQYTKFTFTTVSSITGAVGITAVASSLGPDSFRYRFALFDTNLVTPTPDAWSYEIINASNVTVDSGSITDIYNNITSNIANASSGDYVVKIYATNICDTYMVGSTILPVCLEPAIVTQPSSQTIVEGSPVTFTVGATVTNNDVIYYQWYNTAGPINGAEQASLTLPSVSSADNGIEYYVIVTSGCGTASTTSSLAKLTVQSPATPPIQPVITLVLDSQTNSIENNSTICRVGSLYDVFVDVFNSGGSTVSLYINNNLVGSSFTFSGGLVRINSIAITGYGQQTLVAQVVGPNNNASQLSDPFIINIGAEPNGFIDVTTTMADTTKNGRKSNNFNYKIVLSNNNIDSSPYSLTYTINESNTNVVVASGNIDATLGMVSGNFNEAKSVSYDTLVFATNSCGTRRVGITTTLICLVPTITGQPMGQTVIEGSTVTFSVNASVPAPITLSYQWFKGRSIIGNNAPTLSIPNVPITYNGSVYYVEVTSSCGRTIASNKVTLNVVNAPPSIPIISQVSDASSTPITIVRNPIFPLSYNVYIQSDAGSTVALSMNNTIVGTGVTPVSGVIILSINITTFGKYTLTATASNSYATSLSSNPYTFTILPILTTPILSNISRGISWTQSTSNIGSVITNYNIYRAIFSEEPGVDIIYALYESVPATIQTRNLFSDSYAVTAVDNLGNESDRSNIVALIF